MRNLFILVVYRDLEQTTIMYLGLFDTIKDIIISSGNLLKYSDVNKIERCYKTYKSFFRIINVQTKHKKYFNYYLGKN